jgi:hypothetical protein
LHLLRTRHAGGQVLVDVHVTIDSQISVSEGHYISEVVRSRLLENFEDVTDVTVHIDPEDDEHEALNFDLPMREELLARIDSQLTGIEETGYIERYTFHYLPANVRVEVLMPFAENASPENCKRIEARFREALKEDPLIESFDVHWH